MKHLHCANFYKTKLIYRTFECNLNLRYDCAKYVMWLVFETAANVRTWLHYKNVNLPNTQIIITFSKENPKKLNRLHTYVWSDVKLALISKTKSSHSNNNRQTIFMYS